MAYCASTIGARQAQGIAQTFKAALSNIVNNADHQLSALDMLSDIDHQQIWEWNKTSPVIVNECVHELFAQQAVQRPDELAVSAWDADLTYKDLDDLSSRLAQHLVELGIGSKPETIVPLCFDKSGWTVVAMLGVLKAGGTCAPLNPEHPKQRLEYLIGETRASIALVSPQYATLLQGIVSEVVEVDRTSLEKPLPAGDKSMSSRPDQAAFVVFTSGSTGHPKGVVIEHRALCSSIRAHGAKIFDCESRVLQFGAYTFDVSIAEIFTTLLFGGCVVIPSEHERLNNLAALISHQRVNTAILTPTVLKMLSPEEVPSLQQIITTGEASSGLIVRQWAPKAQLSNLYGPAECTIWAAGELALTENTPGTIIGQGLGSTLWIVEPNNHNSIAPIGAVGELLIQGPILARGYLNDPEKTAGVFIENPPWLSQVPGTHRLYKTGDLVRYQDDGRILYLGRKDTQIKLHGQRIELAEIERQIIAVAGTFEGLRQVAVEAVTAPSSQSKQLLAAFLYLDAAEVAEVSTGSKLVLGIRDALQEELTRLQARLSDVIPAYMIPTLFVPLTQMPTTTSGKLDRSRLRHMVTELDPIELERCSLTNVAKRKPRTNMEKALQVIWAKVLGRSIEAVGADDNFFKSGGDSVGAMRLVAAARDASISITVALVFARPQLSSMANVAHYIDSTELRANPKPLSLLNGKEASENILEVAAMQCGVEPSQIEDIYPCTPLQEGLVAISTTTQSGTYMLQLVFPLPAESSMPLSQFCEAWESTFATHGILRTRIIPTPSTLQVVVREKIAWRTASNLEDYLKSDREALIVHGGQLARFGLVENPRGRHFVWTVHHALYDGWSIQLLLSHVERVFHNGSVPKPAPPFSRFISHLVDMTQGDPTSKTAQFWSNQLSGGRPSSFPQIPPASYQPRPDKQQRLSVQFSRPTASADSANSATTLSTILRAAWAVLLSRYCDTQDIIFGAPVSGRNAPVIGIDEIVGPTLTTVPVRVLLDNRQTVADFLQTVQQQAVDMIPFEQTGLQNIRRLEAIPKDWIDISNLLVIQPLAESEDPTFLGMTAMPRDVSGFDSYGLVMECGIAEGRLEIEARYDSLILSEPQTRRLLYHFEHVIKQLMAHKSKTDVTLADLDIFSNNDRKEILGWNNKPYPQTVESCIHDLFTEQVQQHARRPAVYGWDGSLTYQELDEISTALARYLMQIGVGREVIVPLCLEKSSWTVVAMLAVLKAGGVCAALNPEHPKARLQHIVNETKASTVLVSPGYEHLFDLVSRVIKIEKNSLDELVANQKSSAADQVSLVKGLPGQAAFVVFTSGSTGQPKGIVLEHQALCSSMRAHGLAMGFANTMRRVLQFSAYTFDASLTEIFTTLLHGGCVCVPNSDERINDLSGAINRMHVNLALLTPTVAALIQPEQVLGLQTLVFGGEALNQPLLERWAASKVHLINIYGPAECSIWSAGQVGMRADTTAATIGQGIGTILWITDPDNHNRLSPIGSVGELLIEGPVLARGYLNQPEKTSAAFIENPTWLPETRVSGIRRLYKTGDLVRYNADGSIYYIGRRDTQVKIRGQRLELAEIEHQTMAINTIESLQQVSVEIVSLETVQTDQQPQQNHQQLAAFLHFNLSDATGGNTFGVLPLSELMWDEVSMLQRALADVLPSYMIPSLLIPVPHLPTTTSGKLDRGALRRLAAMLDSEHVARCSLVDTSKDKRAPATEMERRLQVVWASVLSVPEEAIGADDHFFRSGGDSVGAMRLVAACRAANVFLTVATIFSHPQLSSMAKMAQDSGDPGPFTLVPEPLSLVPGNELTKHLLETAARECSLRQEQVEDILPCTPLQEGLVAISTTQPGTYISQTVFRLPKALSLSRFRDAWQKVSELHSILRTRFINTPSNGMWQVVATGEHIEWEASSSLSRYLEADQRKPITLGELMTRYGLVEDVEKHEQYFVWTLHHALYDGWSRGLILQQVEQIFLHDSLTVQPPNTSPFSLFISYLANMDEEASLRFWQSQFSGNRPTSFPLTSKTQLQADRLQRHSVIIHRATGSNFTTSTLLRATWAILQSRYCDSNDVVFGAPLSGRNAPVYGIDQIVGPTISTVPVQVSLKQGDQLLTQFLDGIQQQAIDMIPFEHTGLQKIRRMVPDGVMDLKNLLVIQPRVQSTEQPSLLGLEALPADVTGFDSYALVLECGVEETLDGVARVGIEARYDSSVLSAEETKRLLQHFEHVLLQLCDDSEKTLDQIKVFSESDRRQIMEWNKSTPQVVERCIHEWFSDQAIQRGNATAICTWDAEKDMSFKELDNLSSRLAQHLTELGVHAETIVPLCFDKSVWAIVAMLAVLKSGGSCAVLSPDHPKQRLQYLVDETRAKVVLIAPHHSALFDERAIPHVVQITPNFLDTLPHKSDAPMFNSRPDQAAFVVFTSGSTGQPKGVVLEHQALCSSIYAHGAALKLGPTSRVLQFAAYSFDVSIGEIFSTLIHGGCVVVPSEYDRMNNLAALIVKNTVNTAILTPTVLKMLPAVQSPLQKVVLTGEAGTDHLVQLWANKVELSNLYGPAECSIWSAGHLGMTSDTTAATIGKGLGSRLWIVDQDGLTPIGGVGELLIEGPILARGYLNDSAKTAAAFIENPIWLPKEEEGGRSRRLYKTGDLARYNANGTICYLGRRDTQIKIHGQRLELAEVEHQIMASGLPGLRQAAVEVLQPGFAPTQVLAAFLHLDIAEKGEVDSQAVLEISEALLGQLSDLQMSLSNLLPLYMIPSVFIPVPRMKTNSSGKLDRRELRQLAADLDQVQWARCSLEEAVKRLPSTPMEQKLQILWSKVLEVPQDVIGADDSFFRWGGDSIGAMRLVAAGREEHLDISVATIFSHPQLSAMAQVVNELQPTDTKQDAPKPFSLVMRKNQRNRAL